MATLTVNSYTWKNGILNMAGARIPIAVLEIDCGQAVQSGDKLNTLQTALDNYPDSFVAAGSLSAGPQTILNSFTPFPTETENYYDTQFNGDTWAINMMYSTYSWSTFTLEFGFSKNGNRANEPFLLGMTRTNSRTWECFAPAIFVYDTIGGNYLGFGGGRNSGVYEFHVDPYDLIGVIDHNTVPQAAIVPTSKYYDAGETVSIYTDVNAFLLGLVERDPTTDTDPFGPGGNSDTGGGTGNFDGTSVDVDFASLPTLSAVDTGFITLYNPTLTQLQGLANYMWSDLFDLDTFKKLFADPMQAILGLSIVPGPVPNGGNQVVKVGNISTGITMTKAASQYISIDCGTLNVEEFWGAYLDYEPYTKAEIFLPFIGVHQIAIDDIMNKSVHIVYHIDLLSGGCACEIKCGGSVLYTFVGSCAVSIPITGNDWTNVINGVISIASSIGTMVATGGASAPSSVASIASAAVNNLKPSVEKSGSIANAGGLMAGKVPVLILTRPRQALPSRQNTFTGYPAFITRTLGDLSGYTEVHSIRLSGIDGTESEIDEIEELLKGGVIL